jgi:CHAT domain-containing protein
MSPGLELANSQLSVAIRKLESAQTREEAQNELVAVDAFLASSSYTELSELEQSHLRRQIATIQKRMASKFGDVGLFDTAIASLDRARRLADPTDRLDDYLHDLEWCLERYKLSERSDEVDWMQFRGAYVMALIRASQSILPGHFKAGAFQWTEEDDVDALVRCSATVGEALYLRFKRARAGVDLDLAISWRQAAVPPLRFSYCPLRTNAIHLAHILLQRYERAKLRADVLEASQLARRAVTELPDGDIPRQDHLCVLVATLIAEFCSGGSDESLTEAMTIAQSIQDDQVQFEDLRILELRELAKDLLDVIQRRSTAGLESAPEGQSHRAFKAAQCFAARFDSTRSLVDLNRSIEILEQLARSQSQDSSALMSLSLSTLLQKRYVVSRDSQDLSRALNTATSLVSTLAGDTQAWVDAQILLGACLVPAFASDGGYTIEAKDPDMMRAAADAYRSAAVRRGQAPSATLIEAAVAWAEIAIYLNRHAHAATAYCCAFEVLQDLLDSRPCRDEIAALLHRVPFFIPRAAYALARVSDIAGAIVTLDLGRSILDQGVWEENAADRSKTLWSDIAEYGKSIAEFYEAEYDDGEDPFWSLPGSGDALMAQCWAVQRSTGMLSKSPLRLRTLKSAAQGAKHGKIAWLLPASYGLIITIDSDENVTAKHILRASENDVRRRVHELYKAYESRHEDYARFKLSLSQVCEWMGKTLGSALAEAFEGCANALIVPSGLISLLPIASASIVFAGEDHKSYLLDYFSISFIPSASSLAKLGERLLRSPNKNAIVVEDPRPTKYEPLVFSRLERAAVEAGRPVDEVISGENATRGVVGQTFCSCTVLHFSCHGLNEPFRPFEGGLLLANDEMLKIGDYRGIFNLEDTPRLVFLSACESAAISQYLPDEVIGLPRAFLELGVPGVLGTLWAVSEVDALFLVLGFYRNWDSWRASPAVALQRAQQWVRDSTNSEKVEQLDLRLPEDVKGSDEFRWLRSKLLETPNIKGFTDPVHWAPFVFSGL